MQYLEEDDLGTAYLDAQQAARKQWLKYDEFERLATNEIRSDLPSNMPKVNDGSLSAAIKKIPKRLMAKPMTGKVKATDRDENWVALLANLILTNRIIPNATTDGTFLRKWKVAIKNSKIYGSQPIYTFFTQHGTYTGADMSLPYVRNVYLEPGKVSDLASDYIFMDSFYSKLQLKRLIDKAKEDSTEPKDDKPAAVPTAPKAKGTGKQPTELTDTDEDAIDDADDVSSIWDWKALQAVYDSGPGLKDSRNQTVPERAGLNRNEKGLYKLTTCFNRGYEAPFYTFAPNNDNQVVGTQINTNPTGDLPIIYLYDDEDLINPYGTGLVQAAGATQNVLDNFTQTDVLATQIGNQPPIQVAGDRTSTNLKSMVYAPAQFWLTGNAQVSPVTSVNATMYNAMPTRFGLYKSQLQYQTGTFDNSISAESGNPGFSKTSKGVQALQQVTNADDSDSLQSIADAYQRVIKSMLNIHMNNMEGTELLKLEIDDIQLLATTDLVPTDADGNVDAEQIEVVWDNVRGTFDFTVDAQSSLESSDADQLTQLQAAIQAISPQVKYYVAQDGYDINIGELYHSMFMKLRLDNIDKVITKMTPQEKQQAQSAPFPIIDPPQVRLNTDSLPPEAWPSLLQNAGINIAQDQPQANLSPSYSDQAKILTAQTDAQTAAFNAHTNATGVQGTLIDKQQLPADPATLQPPTAPADPTAQQTGVQASQPPQEADLQPQQTQPQQPADPTAPPDVLSRIMSIMKQYNVDQETASAIASAEDHGATPEQIPQILAYLKQSEQL